MNRLLTTGFDFVRREAAGFLDIIYPPVCGLCGQQADSEDRLICPECWGSIEELEGPYCLECRSFLGDSHKCPHCEPGTITVFSLGYFDGPLRPILHDLKFNGLKPLAVPVGRMLTQMIVDRRVGSKIDLIVPVPLFSARQRSRGYNQSEEIARAISHALGVDLRTDILFMTRKTRQQAKLPASHREANVRGAFAVDDPEGVLTGASVLLVDDVTTTGATLRENARALLMASAGKVTASVAATAA